MSVVVSNCPVRKYSNLSLQNITPPVTFTLELNPSSMTFLSSLLAPTIMVSHDDYVQVITLNSALSYMEAHPAEFPMSNVTKIEAKLKDSGDVDKLKEQLSSCDDNGTISTSDLDEILAKYGLNAHERLTIQRKYGCAIESSSS